MRATDELLDALRAALEDGTIAVGHKDTLCLWSPTTEEEAESQNPRRWDQVIKEAVREHETAFMAHWRAAGKPRVETDVWRPGESYMIDGVMEKERQKTIREVAGDLYGILEQVGAADHLESAFSSATGNGYGDRDWPGGWNNVVFVVEGGSEGWWIHVGVLHPMEGNLHERKFSDLLTLKCLESAEVAHEISEVLNRALSRN